MAVKFFGQFMLENNYVSQELLLKAIALQEASNLKFGEMARSMGLISDSDIDRVHDAQRSEDLQFGDMCVKLGFLTTAQLNEVLTRQKNSHVYIGEALIKAGAIKAEELPRYLDEFKSDQAPYKIDKITIPADLHERGLLEITIDLTSKMLQRIANISFRQGQCMLISRLEANDTIVSIALSGSFHARYLLSVSKSARELIAKAILKSPDVSHEHEDILNDAVMELANIICGNIAAKAAQVGKSLEIAPPMVLDGSKGVNVSSDGKGLLLPLYIANGLIEIGIFIE